MIRTLFDTVQLDWRPTILEGSTRVVVKSLLFDEDGLYSHLITELSLTTLLRDSPLFPPLYSVELMPDSISLVMGKMEMNLSEYLVYTSVDVKKDLLATLSISMLTALSVLESISVVHFDIKPENILVELDNDGTPSFRLADFGLSEFVSRQSELSAEHLYSTLYRPPELLFPKEESVKEPRAGDVWALGVTLRDFLCTPEEFFERRRDVDHLNTLYTEANTVFSYDKFVELITEGEITGRIEIEGEELISKLLTLNPRERPTATSLLESPPVLNYKRRPRRVDAELLTAISKLTTDPVFVTVAFEIATRYCALVLDYPEDPHGVLEPTKLLARTIRRLAFSFDSRPIGAKAIRTEVEFEVMKELGFIVFSPGIVAVLNRLHEKKVDPLSVPLTEFERPLVEWFV